MLRSSTKDSPSNQRTEESETETVESGPTKQAPDPNAEDEVSAFAEPPVISTD